MIRRPRRVTAAVVVAMVLLGLCAAVTVSLVQRLMGAHEYVSYDTVAVRLHDLTWGELPVLVTGIVVAVLGLSLLVIALWPGRAPVLPLAASDEISAGVTRTGLRTALRYTATGVDGLEAARITLRRKVITVHGQTWRSDAAGLPEEVCRVVTERVQQIEAPVRRVRARLRGPRVRGES